MSVFETMLAEVQGEEAAIFAFDKHIARLKKAARELNLPSHSLISETLLERIKAELKKAHTGDIPQYRVRIIAHAEEIDIQIEMFVPRLHSKRGASLYPVILERSLPHIKTYPSPVSIEAQEKAAANGFDEALLIGTDENVREGAWSNFFWFEESGEIVTPKSNLLPGIIRSVFIDPSHGFNVAERDITFSEMLKRARGAFITNATHFLVPVHSIGDTKLEIPERMSSLQSRFNNLRSKMSVTLSLKVK